MKKIFIICLLIFATVLPTFATAWVQIDNTTYIDKDSIHFYVNDHGVTEYTKKSFWIKRINDREDGYFNELKKMYSTDVVCVREREIIDLHKKKNSLKSIILYDINGNVIYSYTAPDYVIKWRDIVPETKGEQWFKLVKNKHILNKMYKNQSVQ